MTRPYSLDLRERAVLVVEAGESCQSVAVRFGVAVSSVVKWCHRYRETGSVAPGKMGGHRRIIPEPYRAMSVEEIERTPHLTVRGLRDILASRGIAVPRQSVWGFLRSQGLSFKKYAVRS